MSQNCGHSKYGFIFPLTGLQVQRGTEEACWAHNQAVEGLKPSSATLKKKMWPSDQQDSEDCFWSTEVSGLLHTCHVGSTWFHLTPAHSLAYLFRRESCFWGCKSVCFCCEVGHFHMWVNGDWQVLEPASSGRLKNCTFWFLVVILICQPWGLLLIELQAQERLCTYFI